jgi:hypothetical protein
MESLPDRSLTFLLSETEQLAIRVPLHQNNKELFEVVGHLSEPHPVKAYRPQLGLFSKTVDQVLGNMQLDQGLNSFVLQLEETDKVPPRGFFEGVQ